MSELEEDIKHCEEVLADWHGCDECKADHERLLSYMKELLEYRKNYYLQSLEYRNRMIGMYKKGLEDIEKYLNEHASEHDGYRIRLDVSEIIRDVEKAADKAGEL